MNDVQRAKNIIEKVSYMALATVDENGNPWNAPVFCAYDKNYNFYWGSWKDSQHSKNIRANGNVYIVIYDSTAPPGEGAEVYIRARAQELTEPVEIDTAHKMIWDRHVVPYWKREQFDGATPLRLYKATPVKAWMNSGDRLDDHYIDTRVKVDLS